MSSSTNGTISNGNESNSTQSYHVGDFIYVEVSQELPFQICYIEHICTFRNKASLVEGNIFQRKNQTSSTGSIKLAEELTRQYWPDEKVTEDMRRILDSKEIFFTDKKKSHLVSSIRGKCNVVLLSSVESPVTYMEQDDTFFYRFSYDSKASVNESFKLKKAETRIGSEYQAIVPETTLANAEIEDTRNLADLETLLYQPYHQLTEQELDTLKTVAISLGLYGRASGSKDDTKEISIKNALLNASRDMTLQNVMNVLHQNEYNLTKTICALAPNNVITICKDKLEEWTEHEQSLFEKGITAKKDFNKIRQDFLPWMSHKCLVNFYYKWKRFNRGTELGKAKLKVNKTFSLRINSSPTSASKPKKPDFEVNLCQSCLSFCSCNWRRCAQIQYVLCDACHIFWKKHGTFTSGDVLEF